MKNYMQLVCSVCLLLFMVISVEASFINYQVGINDNFAPGSEPTAPSTNLVSAVLANQNHQQNSGIEDFQDLDLTAGLNGGSKNRAVGHTFSGLPVDIMGATLELRVRAGNDAFTNSDQILFSFVQYDSSYFPDPITYESYWVDSLAWFRGFGPRDYRFAPPGYEHPDDPGLLVQSPDEWSYGDECLFLLDLAALPLIGGGTLNLIPDLNTYGFLDVVIEDETAVDFMTFTVQTGAVPLPPSFLMFGSGIIGLVGVKMRFFRRPPV